MIIYPIYNINHYCHARKRELFITYLQNITAYRFMLRVLIHVHVYHTMCVNFLIIFII